jgi:hypothetical protein
VVGIPGRVVKSATETGQLEHGKLPDPGADEREELKRRVAQLEELVQKVMAAK